MQTSLAATWSQVVSLLEQGYSVIPVRDKNENGKPAKSPYPYWKKYQSEIVSQADLFEQMSKFGTTAIAIICGKVSGNLEVIDIDIKNKLGIDAKLFSTIKQLYPDLWGKLRIHKSPSGGYHILYRIIDQIPPGNQKLASIPPPAGSNKAPAFIETRGEGGYVLAPPSLGYSIFKPDPIPAITWAERSSLIALCQGYNENIKVDPPPKVNRKDDDYYDQNPFDHFNHSPEASDVLIEYGWKRNGENSEFAWFTRPNSNSKERHGVYIKSKHQFWFWTTNTEFDSGKCYSPSTVLTQLGFSGDFKASYKALVGKGYGKIKKKKEEHIIKLNASRGELPPPNLSKEGKEELAKLIRERDELHPHGIFWELSPDGDRCTIDREALYNISKALGFYLYDEEIILEEKGFLYKKDDRFYFDTLKAYIKEPAAELYQMIVNTYEHFLQNSGKFTTTRLPLLDSTKILNDTSNTCYKFYQDCWIKITSTEILKYSYQNLSGLVWSERLKPRKFLSKPGGRFIDFLEKALDFQKVQEHVLKIIGYLSHEYKDETTAYIIAMTEQCPDPKQGGGSGKNLFCNLFRETTTVATRPGDQIQYDERFFQTWNGERIFVVSDAPKDFKFTFLKEITSGSAVLKKLWKNEKEITVEKLPKIIVNTNFSYEITDGGLKRRIIPLEFTDFFTKNKGVRKYYGKYFPKDWDEEDWAGYDWVIIKGIQTWLKGDLIIEAPDLTVGGWMKQFEQTYGIYTTEFIYSRWPDWVKIGYVTTADFKKELIEYCEERAIPKHYYPSTHRVNKAIEDYCHKQGMIYHNDIQKRVGGSNSKCKVFTYPAEELPALPEPEEPEEELPF